MQDDPRPSHRKVRLLRRWAFLAALLLPLAAGARQAATDTLAGTHPDRPRTCLVLGGGGARGAAHIGVLKVLERERVPVD